MKNSYNIFTNGSNRYQQIYTENNITVSSSSAVTRSPKHNNNKLMTLNSNGSTLDK